jgi:hypothetical protein
MLWWLPSQLVWNCVDLSRRRSRQDFRTIRLNLKRQNFASFGYGGVAPHARLRAGSKVLLVERVAPFRVICPPNRRRRRRFGGNVVGLRDRANSKTHLPSETSSLGKRTIDDTDHRTAAFVDESPAGPTLANSVRLLALAYLPPVCGDVMNGMRLLVLILSVLSCRAALADAPAVQPRPQLQIINGSSQSIDIFWLNDQAERIPNGTLKPGADLSINTTLGHRFAIVGQQDKTEATISSVVPVQGFRFDPTAKEGIPAFYTQQVSANGFPIVASNGVNPLALQEAAWIVNQMLVHRPDIRDAMINSGARLCVMAHDEFTTDLPEFSHLGTQPFPEFPELSGKDYWDARARGTGGSRTDPFCSCAEENLLGYPGDPYHQECILIHEFAHCVHLRGMLNVDPTFDQRLEQTYQQAMAAGLWKAKYASVNHHEYFAEGVQSWFGNNRVNDHDHNHVHTREQLLRVRSWSSGDVPRGVWRD